VRYRACGGRFFFTRLCYPTQTRKHANARRLLATLLDVNSKTDIRIACESIYHYRSLHGQLSDMTWQIAVGGFIADDFQLTEAHL